MPSDLLSYSTQLSVADLGPRADAFRTLEAEDAVESDFACSVLDLEYEYLRAYYKVRIRAVKQYAAGSLESREDVEAMRLNVLFTLRNPFESWTPATTAASMLDESGERVISNGKLDLIRRSSIAMRHIVGAVFRSSVAAVAIPLATGMTPAAARPQIFTHVAVRGDVSPRDGRGISKRRDYLAAVKNDLKQWFGATPRELAPMLGISYATLANVAKPGRSPREKSLRTMLRVHGLARELVRMQGRRRAEAWLQGEGGSLLREHGIDRFEASANRSLFPSRNALNDPHILTKRLADLDIEPGPVSLEVDRF